MKAPATPVSAHSRQAADLIAEEAYQATKDWPVFDASERFQAMLTVINEGKDDQDDDIIAACRKKAGLK